MQDKRDLLKKQLNFLQESKAAAEKAIKIFEVKMKKFQSGKKFESAKNAFQRVKERIEQTNSMMAKVQAELSSASGAKQKKQKAKKPKKPRQKPPKQKKKPKKK